MQTGQKIAVLYNDLSVLEFHHASRAFQIAMIPEANIFSSLPIEQFREVRKLVVNMVIATGMLLALIAYSLQIWLSISSI